MKKKITISGLAGALTLAALMAPPSMAADNGIDSWDLYKHNTSVSLNQQVKMWECWGKGVGTNPKLLQKVGRKWVTLDVSTVSTDTAFCGKKEPIKAIYSFKVKDSLRWNQKKNSYEAVVRTVCSTCETYNWSILVNKKP